MMEKHTMPDGTIPMYGLSPLVVCRQWGDFGINTANNSETTLPIAFASELYVVVITDIASNGYPLSYGVYQLSSKSFYAYSCRINAGNVENVIFGRWIAIGH